ncbi:hypothetical protein FRC17_008839 [Serendipita sp. 399]|nr:hypothetical protein FRC17_008839 [Serendipita sp. 399]
MDHTLGSKEIKSGNVKEMYIEEEARPRQSVSNIILPGTSFYPPATEIDRITEEIKAGIDALAELDAKLEEMHRQRETLIADISQKKSAISKIRLIPVEVFSIIFIFYIAMTDSTFEPSDEADNNSSTTESSLTLPSPWVLMQVCRQWRLAAMHTSSLWSCIRLCTADIAGQRYFSGYEHCHSTAMLRNALARTKGGPIEMIWSFGRFDCSISQQNFWASPQETIDVLRDTGAHLQIRVLGFEKPSPEIIDEVNEIDFVDFQLPTLEELVLCWSSPGLDERIQKTAHRLQYLSFQSTYKRQSDWNLSKMASRLTLELQDHQGFNKPPDPGWALMLSSGVNLVNLTLHDIQIGLSGAQLISIPTLEELDLIKTRFNCKVDFPNLRALSLRSSDFLAHISKPLVLPLLKSLEAHLPNPHDCPLIQAQSLQSLEILSLPTQWSNRTTLEKLFEKPLPALSEP